MKIRHEEKAPVTPLEVVDAVPKLRRLHFLLIPSIS